MSGSGIRMNHEELFHSSYRIPRRKSQHQLHLTSKENMRPSLIFSRFSHSFIFLLFLYRFSIRFTCVSRHQEADKRSCGINIS